VLTPPPTIRKRKREDTLHGALGNNNNNSGGDYLSSFHPAFDLKSVPPAPCSSLPALGGSSSRSSERSSENHRHQHRPMTPPAAGSSPCSPSRAAAAAALAMSLAAVSPTKNRRKLLVAAADVTPKRVVPQGSTSERASSLAERVRGDQSELCLFPYFSYSFHR
jgi:hypothetical protein